MKTALHTATIITVTLALFIVPAKVLADVNYLSMLREFWSSGTIGSTGAGSTGSSSRQRYHAVNVVSAKNDDSDVKKEPQKEDGHIEGMCKVPRQPSVMLCEIGSGFLCIDTPPGGVFSDFVRIRGTIDTKGSVPASIRIAVQHEYTKAISYVDTTNPQTSACWDGGTIARPFCMDAQGRYSAEVPLSAKGPYTISISASRFSGEAVEKKVRTSKVIAIDGDRIDVAFNPDILGKKEIDDAMVTVTADILGECRFCDFIGASTGGVKLKVTNRMRSPDGGEKNIVCETTVVQGGQARYVVGVPTVSGENVFDVVVCNAATGKNCVSIADDVKFTVKGETALLRMISPDPRPAYDLAEYPEIAWSFTLGDVSGCVDMQFNRQMPEKICADAKGEFHTLLKPRIGINVATLTGESLGEQFSWTFGWGKIESPYAGSNSSINSKHAIGLTVAKKAMSDIVVPFLNNFFDSDEFFQIFIPSLVSMLDGDHKASGQNGLKPVLSSEDFAEVAIPGCEPTSSSSGMTMRINGAPKLGSLKIEDFELRKNGIDLSVLVDDLTATIDVSPDQNGDGVADKNPLPIVVSFKTAKLVVSIETMKTRDGSLILISAPYTDCSYKGSYCKGTPASLVPKNFIGNATPWGNFIKCDVSKAKGDAVKACKAINTLNAQLGIVGEMVLDAVNTGIYCGGSKAVSSVMKTPVVVPLDIGCHQGECSGISKIISPMNIPMGVRLEDDLAIAASGIDLGMELSVGDADFFANTPQRYRIDSAGVVTSDESKPVKGRLGRNDLGMSVSLDAISAFLFAAFAHGDGGNVRGLLDLDVHEPFFNELGVDFVKECDDFEPIPGVKDTLPAICYMRPRVMELLGSALGNYGYFPAKQPVMMAFRGNRALGPRIEVVTPEKIPVVPRTGEISDNSTRGEDDVPEGNLVEIALGGVGLSFYALEVDEERGADAHGNLFAKISADGSPVILSMRPDDPDPWNGQIVSFDLTLLLALEISDAMPSGKGGLERELKLRTLADRSRLILTPIAGSNATTIPSRRLISNLSDQLMTAISQLSSKAGAISMTLPKGFEFEKSGEGSLFDAMGLDRIDFGPEGMELAFDSDANRISAAISVIVTQLLHIAGEEIKFVLP